MCKQSACTCDLLLHPSSRTVCLGWLGAAPLERAHLCVCVPGRCACLQLSGLAFKIVLVSCPCVVRLMVVLGLCDR